MNYGLEVNELAMLSEVFVKNTDIEKVILYGSRAKGTYKPGSDIDITLVGNSLNEQVLRKVQLHIDELPLIYNIDVSLFSTLANQDLIDHIQRVGKVLWQREL